MAVTAHAPDLPIQQPLAEHPVVTEPPLEAELLLAQAVVQLGTADWDRVAQLLDQSECWPKEAGKMTSQGYEAAFETLMRKKGLDVTGCQQPRARPARKLVHTLYSSLLTTLRDSLLSTYAEEARLNAEIAEIREGKLDSALAAAAPPSASSSTAANAKPGPSTSGAHEADSSGVEAAGAAEGEGEGVEEVEEEEVESETTPKKAAASKKRSGGGRKSGRTKRGGRAGTVDEEDEGQGVAAEEAVVKEEEEDVEGVDEEVEGDGEEGQEEEEEEEEEEARPKKGGRRKRTAAATAAKRAGKKRKVSEPPTASPPPADDGRKRKRVKMTEEPVEESEKDTKAAVQRRKVAFTRIVEQLQAERYSHFFESRVTKSIAPMYNVAVRRPTCLRDITKAIKSGAISTNTELMRDVALLCANAIQFNGDEGEDSVGYCAKLLWERFERLMDETLATEFAAGEV